MASSVNRIACVIVSYNRKVLLQRCLSGVAAQILPPFCMLVVNNASTDGTLRNLADRGWLARADVELVDLRENLGGAGGFAQGLKRAVAMGADWVWMMDDDAEPHPSALEELMKVASDPCNVYGSVATHGTATSWATTLLGPPVRTVDVVGEVPAAAEVESLPFLGFLIHRELVDRIGIPDADYFIAADDIEYCLRASRAGAKLVIAGKSHIEHPQTQRQIIRVLGQRVAYLKLAPWKRYYDTRNRLLIARKYYGAKLLTQAIPGSFMRLYAALRYEPRKLAQLWAFTAGFVDGLLGLKGKRHTKWGIGQ